MTHPRIHPSARTRRTGGFSLVEMAIVIVLIASVIGMIFTMGDSLITNIRLSTAQNQLDQISLSLQNYYKKHGRLPCPASLETTSADTSYGVPTGTVCNTATVDTGTRRTSGAPWVRMGAVPVATLGLSPSLIGDPWGQRYIYYVSENFVVTGTDVNNGTITVYDDTSTAITSTAAYALVSTGPNKFGSYNVDTGSQIDATALTNAGRTMERENIDYDASVVDAPHTVNSSTASLNFDDLIVWMHGTNMVD